VNESIATAQRGSTGTLGVALWTLAWLLTLALARFGPDLLWGREVAVGLGAGIVGGFAASAAAAAGALPFAVDIALMSVLITVVYLAAIVVGKLRYR
jgi:hypothetical protein